jgi:hypothetical protein
VGQEPPERLVGDVPARLTLAPEHLERRLDILRLLRLVTEVLTAGSSIEVLLPESPDTLLEFFNAHLGCSARRHA